MQKVFLFLSLTFASLPAQAITWDQFWKPFSNRPYYYQPYYPRYYYTPICNKTVYHEEYIPGDYYYPGYTRRWKETIKVPCNSL